MSFDANALEVMIASPGDVASERNIVSTTIHEWNTIHARDRSTVLLPLSWDTHSTPAMSAHPQELINAQVLAHADILVAMFWTRLGSPTPTAVSGTVEEIEKHIMTGKPTLIYFSSQPAALADVEVDQFKKVQEFQKSLQPRGLYTKYDSLTDFADKFRRDLSKTIIEQFPAVAPNGSPTIQIGSSVIVRGPSLSPLAQRMLIATSQGNGRLMNIGSLGGRTIQANNESFARQGDPREEAKALAAIKELEDFGYLEERGHSREVFVLTAEGYDMADTLAPSPSPPPPPAS